MANLQPEHDLRYFSELNPPSIESVAAAGSHLDNLAGTSEENITGLDPAEPQFIEDLDAPQRPRWQGAAGAFQQKGSACPPGTEPVGGNAGPARASWFTESWLGTKQGPGGGAQPLEAAGPNASMMMAATAAGQRAHSSPANACENINTAESNVLHTSPAAAMAISGSAAMLDPPSCGSAASPAPFMNIQPMVGQQEALPRLARPGSAIALWQQAAEAGADDASLLALAQATGLLSQDEDGNLVVSAELLAATEGVFEQQQQQSSPAGHPLGASVGLIDSNQLPSQLILRGLPGQAAAAAAAAAGSSQPAQASYSVTTAGMTAAALANLLAVASLGPDAAGKKSSSGSGKHANAGPAKQHLLYKTELCKGWLETGSCRYGGKCQFAHGPGELRPIPRHPKYRTEVCRAFAATGSCVYGTRCRFIHGHASAPNNLADPAASALLAATLLNHASGSGMGGDLTGGMEGVRSLDDPGLSRLGARRSLDVPGSRLSISSGIAQPLTAQRHSIDIMQPGGRAPQLAGQLDLLAAAGLNPAAWQNPGPSVSTRTSFESAISAPRGSLDNPGGPGNLGIDPLVLAHNPALAAAMAAKASALAGGAAGARTSLDSVASSISRSSISRESWIPMTGATPAELAAAAGAPGYLSGGGPGGQWMQFAESGPMPGIPEAGPMVMPAVQPRTHMRPGPMPAAAQKAAAALLSMPPGSIPPHIQAMLASGGRQAQQQLPEMSEADMQQLFAMLSVNQQAQQQQQQGMSAARAAQMMSVAQAQAAVARAAVSGSGTAGPGNTSPPSQLWGQLGQPAQQVQQQQQQQRGSDMGAPQMPPAGNPAAGLGAGAQMRAPNAPAGRVAAPAPERSSQRDLLGLLGAWWRGNDDDGSAGR